MNKTNNSIAVMAKIMTEVHAKVLRSEYRSHGLMEKSLTDMSMSSFLLNEQEEASLSDSDVDELKASVEKLKSVISDLSSALDAAGGKMNGTKSAVQALGGEIPDPGTLAGMVVDPDPKALAAATEEINKGISNAGSAAASIIEAIKVFSSNLQDAVADVPEEMKSGKTLEELGEEAKKGNLKSSDGKEIKFPEVAKLKSGASKAVTVPKWYQTAFQGGMDSAKAEAGDFMSKVGAFFKGLFGGGGAVEGIDPATFADEIVKCTLEELGAVTKAVEGLEQDMTGAVTDSAGDSAAVQAGASAAQAGEGGGGGETEAGEPSPASEEEGAEEADAAQSGLEGAVQAAAGEGGSPADAIMSAIDGWYDSLSDSSKKSMDSNDRIGSLKTSIKTAVDSASDTLSSSVGDAVSQWRGENEETLLKSRRFAKKNFDSLEDLIPQLAAELLKKTNEAGVTLTKSMVKKSVYRFLNKKFSRQPLLTEAFLPAANDLLGSSTDQSETFDESYEYTEDELVQSRWMRIAGLEENIDD